MTLIGIGKYVVPMIVSFIASVMIGSFINLFFPLDTISEMDDLAIIIRMSFFYSMGVGAGIHIQITRGK